MHFHPSKKFFLEPIENKDFLLMDIHKNHSCLLTQTQYLILKNTVFIVYFSTLLNFNLEAYKEIYLRRRFE